MSVGTPITFFRAFHSRGVFASKAAFIREVSRSVDNDFSPLVQQEIDQTTLNWRRRPDTYSETRVDAAGISHRTYLVGELGAIWSYIDRGVPGRVITPKRARSRTNPKYAAAIRFPNKARRPIFRHRVRWTGIRARNWSATIRDDLIYDFREICEKGARRGVRAAQREGR